MASTAEKPLFMRMEEETDYSQMTPEQQEIYMRSLDTWRTVIAADKFTFTKGFEKGRAEGHAKGRLTIAKTLLDMGMDVEQVVRATGLSEKEINKL